MEKFLQQTASSVHAKETKNNIIFRIAPFSGSIFFMSILV